MDIFNIAQLTCTYHFLTTPEYTQFAESDMKRRTLEFTIRLFNDNNINGSGKSGTIDFTIEFLKITENFN